jgi:hypothetical protein
MKKLTILIITFAAISCKKEKDFKPSFNGRWKIISDTSRYVDVYKTSDSTVAITFPQQMDVPPNKQSPITLTYHSYASNDTVYCLSGNIYPTCYFINKVTYYDGYILEWNQGVDLGTVKEMEQKWSR